NTMVFGDTAVKTWLFNTGAAAGTGKALVVGSNAANGNGAYLTTGGVWTNASDRAKKDHFVVVDRDEILDKIRQLPIARWNYKGLEEQHIGPVAQDFYRLFQVGTDDKTISTIDPSGIALVGVQGLSEKLERQQQEIAQLEGRLAAGQDAILRQQSVIEGLVKQLRVMQQAQAGGSTGKGDKGRRRRGG
ncbi:MAG TPA: tail fiber domain-containing protein, partial [Puia sp.]|nr:tail fiber domain-containing protein [Puia sp.]